MGACKQLIDNAENGDRVRYLFYHFMGDSAGKLYCMSTKYNQGSRQVAPCFDYILLPVCGVSPFAELRCQVSSVFSAHWQVGVRGVDFSL